MNTMNMNKIMANKNERLSPLADLLEAVKWTVKTVVVIGCFAVYGLATFFSGILPEPIENHDQLEGFLAIVALVTLILL